MRSGAFVHAAISRAGNGDAQTGSMYALEACKKRSWFARDRLPSLRPCPRHSAQALTDAENPVGSGRPVELLLRRQRPNGARRFASRSRQFRRLGRKRPAANPRRRRTTDAAATLFGPIRWPRFASMPSSRGVKPSEAPRVLRRPAVERRDLLVQAAAPAASGIYAGNASPSALTFPGAQQLAPARPVRVRWRTNRLRHVTTAVPRSSRPRTACVAD